MENKKWTREEAEQNKNKLLQELKDLPTSEENLDWVIKELDQLSQEEIRDFIIYRLKKICEEAEKLSVNDEDYERADELLKIKNRLK